MRAGGRTDGRTDMTKLIAGFRNFANALKNDLKLKKYLSTLMMKVPDHVYVLG
jgi:hypothetical protein